MEATGSISSSNYISYKKCHEVDASTKKETNCKWTQRPLETAAQIAFTDLIRFLETWALSLMHPCFILTGFKDNFKYII